MTSDNTAIIICELPRGCADPHPDRWYCLRGHDGAAPGACRLKVCRERDLMGGRHDQ